MSHDTRRGTVIVLAQDSMRAAQVEAALHALAGWRVDVGKPPQLRGYVDEHPEAVVVIALPDVDTRRMLRTIRAWPRRSTIITLSDDPAHFWTSAARTLGVRAALPHRPTAEQLVGAVRAVHAGLFVLHPEALMQSAVGSAAVASGAPLTSREREILEMIAEGANNRIIASRLGISRHTVKFHVASILVKLDAESRTGAVAVALRGGLLAV